VIAVLELDAERAAVRDAVAAWCRERGTLAFERARWTELGDLGVLGAGADGESGARELVATCEALGAAATPGPLLETVIALRLLPEPERTALAAGDSIVCLGEPPLLPFAPIADYFVELEGERAFRAQPAAAIRELDTLAGDPWGRVALVRGPELSGAAAALSAGRLAGAALLAAAGRRALEVAAEHARTRKQFGRAIGEFQAVAHPLADAWIRISAAEMLARAAAQHADVCAPEAPALAAAAWLSARRAALGAALRAHQTFGAVGITLEGPVFHLTRRIRQWASLALAESAARARVAAQSGLAAEAAP
jgi:alkylation response protein AidB-like acyl-CoA dehydrogenase